MAEIERWLLTKPATFASPKIASPLPRLPRRPLHVATTKNMEMKMVD